MCVQVCESLPSGGKVYILFMFVIIIISNREKLCTYTPDGLNLSTRTNNSVT